MWLYVTIGAGTGGLARYLLMSWAGKLLGNNFPYGTLITNVSGGLGMGLLIGLLAKYLPPQSQEIRAFAGVGILGGFTTFSTFSLDSVTLIERGQMGAAMLYIMLSVVLSIAALFAGLWVLR